MIQPVVIGRLLTRPLQSGAQKGGSSTETPHGVECIGQHVGLTEIAKITF